MNIIKVNEKEQLDSLYSKSALTIEGLMESYIDKFAEWYEIRTKEKVEEAYVIKGKFMNDSYGLTGSNAYPDDLTIISIPYSNPTIALARFEIGARWFDDIVDNNLRRESNYDNWE